MTYVYCIFYFDYVYEDGLFLLPLLKSMCLDRPVCSSYFDCMPNMSRAMKLLPPIRVWCLHSMFSQISSHGQPWNQIVCIYVGVVLWEFSYHVHTGKLLIHCFVSFQGLSNYLHTAKPWYGHSSTDKSSHSTHKKVCPYTLFHVCCRPLVCILCSTPTCIWNLWTLLSSWPTYCASKHDVIE